MEHEDWLERTVSGGGRNETQSLQTRYPYLIIYGGADAGKRYPLQYRRLSIGRATEADIPLNDRKVSKIHCTIEYDGKEIILEDNNSTNGLFVNGERVQHQILTNNSHLQVGDTAFKIDYKDPEELKFEDDLIRKATTDPLSAIGNRAFFEKRAREELAFVKRSKLPIGVVMIDIDFFKQVNDTHGHQAGDYVIGQIARLMDSQRRTEDVLARYGGEEFVLLVRGAANCENALALCERIRTGIESYNFIFNHKYMHITISMGLCFEPDAEHETLERIIQKADLALYKAKHNGRNRVELHVPPTHTIADIHDTK